MKDNETTSTLGCVVLFVLIVYFTGSLVLPDNEYEEPAEPTVTGISDEDTRVILDALYDM